DKPLELMVHIELTGTPVGVKTQGGVLDFVTRELLIECLPMDIPEKITVDVSALELNKHVRVSEITVPQRVKVLTEADLVIAHVVVPRAEVTATPAEAEAAEAATTAEPEVIKKGKTAEPEEAAATKEKK
ncbi:MAG: 50S ribosomal protein L25, partial [Vicinamibacteria bacterium]|nr:50S ribosomal protein L25 [Vicinamibacteria bacterium]